MNGTRSPSHGSRRRRSRTAAAVTSTATAYTEIDVESLGRIRILA
jgi:hypothetical protein